MSSHHFVKEQQEPALLILDVSNNSFETISPLLEWSPTVLVAESAINAALSWGIKIDVILASDEFRHSHLTLLEEQYPVKFMTIRRDDFLEEGLHFLIASKHGAVNVAGYDHKRVSELDSFIHLIDIVIIDGPIRYFPVKKGEFRKWYAGVSIQLHGPEGTLVELKTVDNSQIIKITHATFVEVQGQVSFHSPDLFWIGEMMVEF